jgi:hypothetical protein
MDRYLSSLNVANKSFEDVADFRYSYFEMTLTHQNMIKEIKGR